MADTATPAFPDPQVTNGDEPEDTYDPSALEVTRGREQGLGFGARDLQLQQDPSGGDDETEAARLMRATAPTSGLTGLPDTEAQTGPTAEPGYSAVDGEEAEAAGDSEPDGNRRA